VSTSKVPKSKKDGEKKKRRRKKERKNIDIYIYIYMKAGHETQGQTRYFFQTRHDTSVY
jgi:transcription antitermination factor NusG